MKWEKTNLITDGNEIIITEASREDAEGIAALERVCFPENEAEEAASIERRLEAVPGCFLLALPSAHVVSRSMPRCCT